MRKPMIATLRAVWREEHDEEDIVLVEDVTDGTWRHGSTHRAVFLRACDSTYWAVGYRSNPGWDYNDFRDGDLGDDHVIQVFPHDVVIRDWRASPDA